MIEGYVKCVRKECTTIRDYRETQMYKFYCQAVIVCKANLISSTDTHTHTHARARLNLCSEMNKNVSLKLRSMVYFRPFKIMDNITMCAKYGIYFLSAYIAITYKETQIIK
jgi:hypothetical protein